MASQSSLFTSDFKPAPYWWDNAQPEPRTDAALPDEADVVIIGSGYTGLHAAIQTAREGLSTLVLDAESAGFGCSTRNGGQISTSVKPDFAALSSRYGEKHATDILKEGQASLDYIERFVREEQINCRFEKVGRFHGAHTARLFQTLSRACKDENPAFKNDAYMVSRADQHTELATDVYHGGVVFPHHASIDPGQYHQGLLRVAREAGACVISHCRVAQLQRTGNAFQLETSRGPVRAGRVILATNGYTGPLTPWHQRRVIPIGSYIIATEEIAPEQMDRLMPKNRILSDTRKLVYYYRPSPDRKRILFGGRVSLHETDPRKSGPKLHAELLRLLPQLKGTRISHSWNGFVAFSFDSLMHKGQDNGLYYAMGYCGSGVGMASYLGMRMGRQAAGRKDGKTAFDTVPFQTRPLYTGNPWFLAPSVLAYRLRDRLGV
ncbi:MAG: FAD-binding oxidoreductase [Rhizobiaceae bacterium]|nr:FAD-binding oxidoreductase [Rhizobiaceae bacterium]